MSDGRRFDALVIGGGLLGCATAWMIARDGGSVLLAERDQVNQHASGQNAGSLHFQLEYRMVEHGLEAARKAAEAMPLHLDAARLWAELPAESGEDIEVKQTGGLMLAETPAQAALLEQKSEIERSWGLDVEMLDRAALARLAPYLSESVIAAAFCPIEGKADTRTAAPALARAAAREGASVRTRCEVVAMRREAGAWRVTLADAEGVSEIVADAVVIAAGVAILTFLLFYVVPRFAAVLQSAPHLPATGRLLVGWGALVDAHRVALLAGLDTAVFAEVAAEIRLTPGARRSSSG